MSIMSISVTKCWQNSIAGPYLPPCYHHHNIQVPRLNSPLSVLRGQVTPQPYATRPTSICQLQTVPVAVFTAVHFPIKPVSAKGTLHWLLYLCSCDTDMQVCTFSPAWNVHAFDKCLCEAQRNIFSPAWNVHAIDNYLCEAQRKYTQSILQWLQPVLTDSSVGTHTSVHL